LPRRSSRHRGPLSPDAGLWGHRPRHELSRAAPGLSARPVPIWSTERL